MKTACVILAAGLGKRMNSSVPKVLHRICGRTMLQSVINTAKKLNPEKIIIVAGNNIDRIRASVESEHVIFVLQKEARGTGHALACSRSALKDFSGNVIVLNGDAPLVSPATIRKFLGLHNKDRNRLSVLSFIAKDPEGYGRICRDESGRVLSIIEESDAAVQQKSIREVNSGVYAIRSDVLCLPDEIRLNRLKKEYYLTDIVAASAEKGLKTSSYCIGTEEEFMGINTMEELYRASVLMKENIVRKWTEKGVYFVDAASVYIDLNAAIGKETTIYPNVHIEGSSKIGRGSIIYPNVRVRNCDIGSGVIIKDSSVMEDSTVREKATIGPFAHIRPGSVIGAHARVGNFVELKKATLGRSSKASHLSYLGDTRIGSSVNIGAGTITCNYDGEKKHMTVIEDGVFVGSDSQLVAPVRIGKRAYIGAGSTITRDVPPGALALSRTEQKNIKDWAKKKARSQRPVAGGKKQCAG